MSAHSLEEAIRWQNGTAFGLTAGLHSLDAAEIRVWLDAVEAGNLYVNRTITGAIVRRQPFGGWKRSAVGPGAKAGGPGYVRALGALRPAPPSSRTVTVSLPRLARLLRDAAPLAGEDFAAVVAADEAAVRTTVGVPHDPSALTSELNVLRYRPVP
ncbi:aldehyde dehydrogenase family protein [Tessaracoccus coleopterorum]|uniref:aldehyde dehydrogenase family protein n=1 Tax=Tessaracoccus coleopterorum TaxID=2714950 RepID=UPI0018D2D051